MLKYNNDDKKAPPEMFTIIKVNFLSESKKNFSQILCEWGSQIEI